jgi:deaminated glutathione amidase
MKVAAVQMSSTADKAANLAAADRLTRAAAADGARLIVLPEKWTVIGTDEQLREGAETLDGPAISWARAIARELGVDLVAGSIAERRVSTEKLANTSVHVDPRGEIKAVYRKVHMFDVEIDGRSYSESDVEQAGDEIVSSVTDDGVELGLAICYDLRFPELFRILAVRGARVIVLPSAFTLPTTRDHWETLLRARAIENQTFVIAANQVGPHPGGQRSGGRSMVVDPWGVVLAQAPDRAGYAVAECDLDSQREIRAKLPSLANRRPAAYRWPETAAAREGEVIASRGPDAAGREATPMPEQELLGGAGVGA